MIKVYADTSVFGGVFDSEFESASREFFEKVKLGIYRIVISNLVRREMDGAPEQVQNFYREILPYAEIVDTEQSALDLRDAYLESGVVTGSRSDDALHVALATVNLCDLIVRWNFKHIVNFQRISRYSEVNKSEGFEGIAIHSPLEVIEYE